MKIGVENLLESPTSFRCDGGRGGRWGIQRLCSAWFTVSLEFEDMSQVCVAFGSYVHPLKLADWVPTGRQIFGCALFLWIGGKDMDLGGEPEEENPILQSS